jgi:hypothetical protein
MIVFWEKEKPCKKLRVRVASGAAQSQILPVCGALEPVLGLAHSRR